MRVELRRVAEGEVPPIERYPDRTLFQTPAWLAFVSESQSAEPVWAEVRSEGAVVGRFAGLVVRRWGMRILGSPLPGWTTSYMGFNLEPGIPRREALFALERFTFGTLKCAHFEIMDRGLTPDSIPGRRFRFRLQGGFEIFLGKEEGDLFTAMKPACRRCIRKAERSGVVVEAASDAEFVDEYYAQLQDVFGKQKLVPTYAKERVQSLVNHLLPTGHLLLVRARAPDGTSIATGIFPAFHDRMFFWGGASWRAHQHLRPNEAVQWFAMRYWRDRGVSLYDMMGGGEYKRKYGGEEIQVPWIRASRFPFLEHLRETARRSFSLKQRVLGIRRGR